MREQRRGGGGVVVVVVVVAVVGGSSGGGVGGGLVCTGQWFTHNKRSVESHALVDNLHHQGWID